MRSALTCLAIGLIMGGATLVSRCAGAAPLDPGYCHEYAEHWYEQAVALGSEEPDAVYEQAQAECDEQVYSLGLWRDAQRDAADPLWRDCDE